MLFNISLPLICCCCQVASVVSDSVRPHGLQPTRLLCPWDSPGKNTGVGCHFLLHCHLCSFYIIACISFFIELWLIHNVVPISATWENAIQLYIYTHCFLIFFSITAYQETGQLLVPYWMNLLLLHPLCNSLHPPTLDSQFPPFPLGNLGSILLSVALFLLHS